MKIISNGVSCWIKAIFTQSRVAAFWRTGTPSRWSRTGADITGGDVRTSSTSIVAVGARRHLTASSDFPSFHSSRAPPATLANADQRTPEIRQCSLSGRIACGCIVNNRHNYRRHAGTALLTRRWQIFHLIISFWSSHASLKLHRRRFVRGRCRRAGARWAALNVDVRRSGLVVAAERAWDLPSDQLAATSRARAGSRRNELHRSTDAESNS